MTEAVIVAVITGALALLGQAIVGKMQNNKTVAVMQARMDGTDKLMDTKLDGIRKDITTLSARVEKHNNFAARMPVVEEQIKVINHRLEDLEHE